MGIGPPRDIAGGVDSRCAGLQVFVHDHAAVDREAGLLGEPGPRPHADANDHQIGRQRRSAFQPDLVPVDRSCRLFEMEDDAVLFVQFADEVADFTAEDALHRPPLGGHDMDLQLAGAQGRGGLEPDEARAHHDGVPRLLAFAMIARLSPSVRSIVDMRRRCAGNVEANRLGAGREHELVVGQASPPATAHRRAFTSMPVTLVPSATSIACSR